MIISTDEKRESVSDVPHPASPSDDPPPSYTLSNDPPPPPPSHPSSPSSPSTSSPPPPFTTSPPSPPLPKARNYVQVQRANGSITDSWVIDPYLTIPEPFLPSLLPGESSSTRKNLYIDVFNGQINAELRVVGRKPGAEGDAAAARGKRATVSMSTRNGIMNVIFHDTESRPPTSLNTKAYNGTITLSLPRSFRGPIGVRTPNGRARFSDAVKENLNVFGEEGFLTKTFLGSWEYDGSEGEDPASKFDIVEAESKNGSVYIQFVDELAEGGNQEVGPRKKKSWSMLRWLGL